MYPYGAERNEAATDAISGQIIIDELVRNMELGRFEMGYSILLPCIFSIYLHPDDYARLAGVQDLIKEDARRALTPAWRSGTARRRCSSAARREAVPHRAERLVDRVLRRQRRRGAAGRRGDPLGAERRAAARLPRHQDHADRPRAFGDRGARGARPHAARGGSADKVFAEIRYEDDSGPQSYFVTQNEISIGRGGDDLSVDLPLYTNDEVSREHLRLRRDPATGSSRRGQQP